MGVLLQGQRSLSNAASTQPGIWLRVQWRVHAGAPLELATLSSAYREGAENSVRLPISIHSFTSSLPGKRLIVSRRTSHGCEDIALCMYGAKSTALTRLLRKHMCAFPIAIFSGVKCLYSLCHLYLI